MAWTEESGLRAQAWAKELLKRAINKSVWFGRYAGTDINSVVQVKEDLTKSAGDRINFGLLPRIEYRSVDNSFQDSSYTKTGDTAVEESEEDLSFYDDVVTVDQYRHAVKSPGRFYEQKVSFDVRNDMAEALSIWLKEELDWRISKSFYATSPTNKLYADTATTVSEITSSMTIDLLDISRAKRFAQWKRVRPITINGTEYYLFLLHPEVMGDLRTKYSTSAHTWFDAMQQAMNRGGNNPIWTGAAGIYDGVILTESRDVYKSDNASGVPYAINLMLGAQAALWAWAKKPFWVEKLFDYKNRLGIASGYIGGAKKAVFSTSTVRGDHGVVAFYCAATEVEPDSAW